LQPAHLVFGGDFSGEPCAAFLRCPQLIPRELVGVVGALGEADKAAVVVDVGSGCLQVGGRCVGRSVRLARVFFQTMRRCRLGCG